MPVAHAACPELTRARHGAHGAQDWSGEAEMTSFIQQQRTVEAAVASLQDDTRKLEELQERAALAVDGAEEARTSGLAPFGAPAAAPL